MKELIHAPCHHRLMEDDDGHLFLEVDCGTTAVFLLTIELKEAERLKFETEGARYLFHLASQVQDDPDEYSGRKVP